MEGFPLMYKGVVAGAATSTVTAAGVTVLPNTGGSFVINLAISVAAGLVTWGVLYSRAMR